MIYFTASEVHGTASDICISPYSLQDALAMVYCGADGNTHRQMAQVLGFPKNTSALADLFQTLNTSLQQSASQNQVSLEVANRLFGEEGFTFREDFLDLLNAKFNAPLEEMNFQKEPLVSTARINKWVAKQTHNHIQDLIPNGAINETTKLVLANALYFKAAWADTFPLEATKPLPFLAGGHDKRNVPTMINTSSYRYQKTNEYTAVGIPFRGGDFQFTIILPDKLKDVPHYLTEHLLSECARLPVRRVKLFLPKFKLEPPTMALGKKLQVMGLKAAFDIPKGSAHFERIAPRHHSNYLYISEIFHKAFVALDEKGIEAAAATAVVMQARGSPIISEPIEVRIDRPFYFAIQHIPSRVCLFMGLLSNPH